MLEAILYDFDGVIVESHQAMMWHFRQTLTEFGYRIPEDEEFIPLTGWKTEDMLRVFLPSHISDAEFNRIFEFNKHKSLEVVPLIKLIPGADQVLQLLHQRFKQGLVTNRGRASTDELLRLHGLDTSLNVVITKDDVKNAKPSGDGIKKGLNILGVNPEDALYLGDTPGDYKASIHAGVAFIFISELAHPEVVTPYMAPNITEAKLLIESRVIQDLARKRN